MVNKGIISKLEKEKKIEKITWDYFNKLGEKYKDDGDSYEKSNKTNPVKNIKEIKVNHNRTKSDIHLRNTKIVQKFITDAQRKKSTKNSFKDEEQFEPYFDIINEEKEDKMDTSNDNENKPEPELVGGFKDIKSQISVNPDIDKPSDPFQKTHKTDIDYNIQESTVVLNDSVDEVSKIHSDLFQKVVKHEWKVIVPQRDVRLGLLNKTYSKIGLVQTVNAHLDSVRRVNLFERSTLFSAGEDGIVKEWNIKAKDDKFSIIVKNKFRYHDSPIFSTAISQNHYFSGDAKGNLLILEHSNDNWNFNRSFNTGNEPIWDLDYCCKNNLVTSTTPNKIKFWDVNQLSDKKPRSFISSTNNFYTEAKWFDNNKCVIHACDSIYKNSNFLFYDLQKETEYRKISQENTVSNTFKILKDDNLIIAANDNNTISIYDMREQKPVKNFIAHSNPITAMDIQGNSNFLITGDLNGSIRLWDFQSFRCIQELSVHRNKYSESVLDIKIHLDAQLVATAGADSTIRLFSLN